MPFTVVGIIFLMAALAMQRDRAGHAGMTERELRDLRDACNASRSR